MPNPSAWMPTHPPPAIFSLDLCRIGLTDRVQSIEPTFFSLSKKPDMQPCQYADQDGNVLMVMPSDMGLPTVWDTDIIVFAVSSIVDAKRLGEAVSPTIRFRLADVIGFGRMTKSSPTYRRLENAIQRLAGCTLTTSPAGGNEAIRDFRIIEQVTIKRRHDRVDGRLEYVEFTLSDWLWRAIEAREVLSLHPDYFRLRKPLARRLYELARTHCGRQPTWQISLEPLHRKSGSKMSLKSFRHEIRKLGTSGDLLDYDMQLSGWRSADIVRFQLRKESGLAKTEDPGGAELSDQTLHQAGEITATAASVDAAAAARYAAYAGRISAWRDRAVAWWKTLPATKQVELAATHGPRPTLITFIGKHRVEVGVDEMVAARVYAIFEPPPTFEGDGYAAYKAAQLHDSWLSDESFCEFHDIDHLAGWDAA